VSGCCGEFGCKRRRPISLYKGDFGGQVFAVTRSRQDGELPDGRARMVALERHDVTEQLRRFIVRECEWRRWQHRGAPSYRQGISAAIASPAHAEGIQAACRRRRLPCPWCGRGQP
jgi:hypothetical protein